MGDGCVGGTGGFEVVGGDGCARETAARDVDVHGPVCRYTLVFNLIHAYTNTSCHLHKQRSGRNGRSVKYRIKMLGGTTERSAVHH